MEGIWPTLGDEEAHAEPMGWLKKRSQLIKATTSRKTAEIGCGIDEFMLDGGFDLIHAVDGKSYCTINVCYYS